MPQVKFNAELKDGADAQSVKKDLEALASTISVKVHHIPQINYYAIDGFTDQSTYERVFAAKLQLLTYDVVDLMRGKRTVDYYQEVTPSKVPSVLQDRVKSVSVEMPLFLHGI